MTGEANGTCPGAVNISARCGQEGGGVRGEGEEGAQSSQGLGVLQA